MALCTAKRHNTHRAVQIGKNAKPRKETLYNEIIFVFGQPDEDLGSGLVIAGYVFEDSKPVLHFFTGDTLQGGWEIKKTGKKIIYIPLQLDK